jgi:hypothetical protein
MVLQMFSFWVIFLQSFHFQKLESEYVCDQKEVCPLSENQSRLQVKVHLTHSRLYKFAEVYYKL